MKKFSTWFNKFRLQQHIAYGFLTILFVGGLLLRNAVITTSEFILAFMFFTAGCGLIAFLEGWAIEEFQKWQRKSQLDLNWKSVRYTGYGGLLSAPALWFFKDYLWATIASGILLLLLTVYYFIDEKNRTK